MNELRDNTGGGTPPDSFEEREFKAKRKAVLFSVPALANLSQLEREWAGLFFDLEEGDITTRLTEIYNVPAARDKEFLVEELKEALDVLVVLSVENCIDVIFYEDPTMTQWAKEWKDDGEVFPLFSKMALALRKNNQDEIEQLKAELFAMIGRKIELQEERRSNPEEISLIMEILIKNLPLDFYFDPAKEETVRLNNLAGRLGNRKVRDLLNQIVRQSKNSAETTRLVNRLKRHLGL